jgi:hypothetical protein
MLRNAILNLPPDSGGSLGTEEDKLQAASPSARLPAPEIQRKSRFRPNPGPVSRRKGPYFKRVRTKFVTQGINGIFGVINEFKPP